MSTVTEDDVFQAWKAWQSELSRDRGYDASLVWSLQQKYFNVKELLEKQKDSTDSA